MTDHVDDADATEIDLLEIYGALKPFLLPAVIFGLLCGISGYFYAKSIQKIYSATAQFTIRSDSGSKIANPNSIFSSFLPSGGGSNEAALSKDKIRSRDFIISLFDEISIDEDPFFTGENNKTNPLNLIKAFIRGSSGEAETVPVIEKVVGKYQSVVGVNLSQSTNIISLSVKHADPEAAATLANTIVDVHTDNIAAKRAGNDSRQVELTGQRLVKAQQDLDDAQKEARKYTIENNVRSIEDLGVRSMSLTRFRKEIESLDAILAGIAYLKEQRESSSARTVNTENFFGQYPTAFTPLQREFGWTLGQNDLSIPTQERLLFLERSKTREREQLQRTLQIMETEASKNAEAAGRLAELQRDIEVREAIYTNLVAQFNARELGALLQGETLEIIQKATAPLKPASPRVRLIALVAMILGTLIALAFFFAKSLRSGTLHTSKKLQTVFRTSVLADDVSRSIGKNAQSLSTLIKRSGTLNNAKLTHLSLSLHADDVKKVALMGVPRTPVVRNLAGVLAGGLVSETERCAVVDLRRQKKTPAGTTIHSHGVLVEVEATPNAVVFTWAKSPSGDENAMPFNEALALTEKSFDRIIVVCAPIRHDVPLNMTAINWADRILLLAKKGTTTRSDTDWVKQILSKTSRTKTHLILE